MKYILMVVIVLFTICLTLTGFYILEPSFTNLAILSLVCIFGGLVTYYIYSENKK